MACPIVISKTAGAIARCGCENGAKYITTETTLTGITLDCVASRVPCSRHVRLHLHLSAEQSGSCSVFAVSVVTFQSRQGAGLRFSALLRVCEPPGVDASLESG